MRRASTIGTTLIALIALTLLAGCGASTGSGRTGGGTPTVTAVPPTPTATPPTPTPTVLEQHLEALVRPAIGTLAHDVTVSFDQASETATVTATVDQGPDVPTTQERVKTVCFRALEALWTSGESFKDVSVAVLGPVQDDYGSHIIAAYGSADVTAQTAAKLNWAGLTPDTAWNAYTAVFLAPSYAAGQYWGLPTPTP
jgi:hypothetical protein